MEGFIVALPGKDLAVLRLREAANNCVPLEPAEKLPRQADSVIALGAPLGLTNSVSTGIVASIRTGEELATFLPRTYEYKLGYDIDARWIHTTAPISHGNSGGPLVNREGKVVGINTWHQVEGDPQNMNFAIGVEHLRTLGATITAAVQPFDKLPIPAPTPRERDIAKRVEAEKELIARADAEHKRVLALIKDSSDKRFELSRLHEQLLHARSNLGRIKSEGLALAKERGDVLAQARAAFHLGTRVAERLTVIYRQQPLLQAAIRRREVAVAGGPVFLDSYSEGFSSKGVAALRRAAVELETEADSLRRDATVIEARILELDSKARSQLSQLRYLDEDRTKTEAEIKQLTERITALGR